MVGWPVTMERSIIMTAVRGVNLWIQEMKHGMRLIFFPRQKDMSWEVVEVLDIGTDRIGLLFLRSQRLIFIQLIFWIATLFLPVVATG